MTTMARLAILSGRGPLPVQLARAYPDAMVVSFRGVPHDHGNHGNHGRETRQYEIERLGSLLEDLRRAGVQQVVLAGAMAHPRLAAARFDGLMVSVGPRLVAALQQGDNAVLGVVVGLLEAEGFRVRGAHELLPQLVMQEGCVGPSVPLAQDLEDAAQAMRILAALSPLDIGQGAVVAAGLCLGIETLQGTDALLSFVAGTRPDRPQKAQRGRGVLVKAAKRNQDLRIDMPAIGPDTIYAAHRAGLAGVCIAAEQVLVLQRGEVETALAQTRVFLQALVLR